MDEVKLPLKAFIPPAGAKRLAGVNHQQLAKTAQEKLRHMSFDPIAELVSQYEWTCQSLARMDFIRDNQHDFDLVPEYVSKKYSPRLHAELMDRMTNITKELLRYGYSRVSESNELVLGAPPVMQIQLTKKGDVFEIGGGPTSDTPSDTRTVGDHKDALDEPW